MRAKIHLGKHILSEITKYISIQRIVFKNKIEIFNLPRETKFDKVDEIE